MTTHTHYAKNFPVSWEQFHRDARALAVRLHAFAPFIGIVAITRGGLVPAAIVARELNIRLVETICIASYDGQKQDTATLLKGMDGKGEGWLIIDDLVDTGRTAKHVRAMLPAARFATVYAKPAGAALADAFVTQVSQDTWILFPWDAEVQYVRPLCEKDDV